MSTDFDNTNYIIEMSKNLGEINAKLGSLVETLTNHENRLCSLEHHQTLCAMSHNNDQQPVEMKDKIMKWMAIALIISLGTIATLTGSAGIIKSIFGV